VELFGNVRDFRVNLQWVELQWVEGLDDGVFPQRPTQQVDLPATLAAKRKDFGVADVVLNDRLRANGASRLANHASPSDNRHACGAVVRMNLHRSRTQSLAAVFVSDFLVSDFVSDFDSDFDSDLVLLLSEAFLSASAAFL
jgi:hypothetical protein